MKLRQAIKILDTEDTPRRFRTAEKAHDRFRQAAKRGDFGGRKFWKRWAELFDSLPTSRDLPTAEW